MFYALFTPIRPANGAQVSELLGRSKGMLSAAFVVTCNRTFFWELDFEASEGPRTDEYPNIRLPAKAFLI